MLNGVVDIAHCWSGDWIQMTHENQNIAYFIPRKAAFEGNDIFVILLGRAASDRGAPLHRLHARRADQRR